MKSSRTQCHKSGPNDTGDFGRVADEPVVGEVVFGARFACYRVVTQIEFFAGFLAMLFLGKIVKKAAFPRKTFENAWNIRILTPL